MGNYSGAGFPEKNDQPSLVSGTEAQGDITLKPLARARGGRKTALTLFSFIAHPEHKEKPKMPKELTHYDAVIADLEAERDQLNTMIAMLKQKKTGAPIVTTAAISSSARLISAEDIPHDAFFGMSLPNAAHEYLSLVKTAKRHPDLCEALLNGGFKSSASNFPEVVRSTLSRHPDFVKVRRGQWGLKEWYGNRGRKGKSQTEEHTEAVNDERTPRDTESA
jgi:hypothetical protein